MNDLDKRLEAASQKSANLSAAARRLEGKLDAALSVHSALEAECRAKGVEPSQLDATIAGLEAKLAAIVEDIETQVANASNQIAPYLKEMN